MKKLLLFLLPLSSALGCGSASGDGEVLSCSCDVSYVSGNNVDYYMGSMDVSLCEVDFTKSHVLDAQSECLLLVNKADTEEQTHLCACSCVHLVEGCNVN